MGCQNLKQQFKLLHHNTSPSTFQRKYTRPFLLPGPVLVASETQQSALAPGPHWVTVTSLAWTRSKGWPLSAPPYSTPSPPTHLESQLGAAFSLHVLTAELRGPLAETTFAMRCAVQRRGFLNIWDFLFSFPSPCATGHITSQVQVTSVEITCLESTLWLEGPHQGQAPVVHSQRLGRHGPRWWQHCEVPVPLSPAGQVCPRLPEWRAIPRVPGQHVL